MLLTEEEAKTKLCPEAIGPGDINWAMVPTGRMCIGSACMAWRWHEFELDPNTGLQGFCGKAGRVY